jgi:hypothetical protein
VAKNEQKQLAEKWLKQQRTETLRRERRLALAAATKARTQGRATKSDLKLLAEEDERKAQARAGNKANKKNKNRKSSTDALNYRLPGSFGSGKR